MTFENEVVVEDETHLPSFLLPSPAVDATDPHQKHRCLVYRLCLITTNTSKGESLFNKAMKMSPSDQETEMNIPSSVSDVNASTTPTKFRWIQVVELGYIEDNEAGSSGDGEVENVSICFHCGTVASEKLKLSKCSKCQVASYW